MTKFKLFALSMIILAANTACNGKKSGVSYEFTTVRRSTLERSVSSSGTINPVSTARVLSQMSGKVEKIFFDFNDTVKRGDVLAELNTDMLRLRREQQYAAVNKARSNYHLQQLNYNNQLALAERNLISDYDLLISKTNLENLESDLAFAEANLRTIETEINQFAFITSPIDGIVLDRRINEGDSVTDSSSSSTASIFTIAENLNEMQIEANIGELDVASIYRGQAVRFTLESMPDRRFSGVVENLRLAPVVVNNVVSYTVIIRVDNLDGTLLPGMTCAVEFIVERTENTLVISNTALRYQPTSLSSDEIEEKIFYASLEFLSEDQKNAAVETRTQAQSNSQRSSRSSNTGISAILTGQGRSARPTAIQGQARATGNQERMRNLWYIDDSGNLQVMQVRTGIAGSNTTEIFSLEDIEGREFILRERL